MQKTQNYQLNQWAPEDHVVRTDFNEDNAKVDAALSALSSGLNSGLSALSSEMQTGMSALSSEMQTGLGNLSSDVDSRVSALSSNVDSQVNALSSNLDSRVNGLSADVDSRLGTMSSGFDSRINTLSWDMNSRMDTMSSGFDSRINTLAAQLAAAGNCRIATGSYVGTGDRAANTVVTFPFTPKIAFILEAVDGIMGCIFIPGMARVYTGGFNGQDITRDVTFSNNQLTIFAMNDDPLYHLNRTNTYYWVALA